MAANPFVGVVYHWVGGLAAASFYIPYRGVKNWAWETFWLVGGVFSWIIAPIVLAGLLVPGLWNVLRESPGRNIGLAYLFGVLWGVGGLTFGLSMRYLGIALGYAIALGFCAAFGTLIPPIFNGELPELARESSGQVILLGIAVCLAGIAISAVAGMSKEHELSDQQKKDTITEFHFAKGMLVAIFAGVMSACFAYGLTAGKPIAAIARQQLMEHNRLDLWQNLPVLIVVLWGGFTTNFIWCLVLNIRNGTGGEYLGLTRRANTEVRPYRNYALCAIAGVTWYLQFFFYSMGQTKMGKYDFSSWTLHMASIIIFSTLWGVAMREWKGTSRRTHLLIGLGLAVLIGSTMIVGYGNFLKART